ncbi:hypothetical protein LV78_006550 [Actinosynnema pretiosum]|nr:hypothetical protein [Actinosynnema pretiosum]
MLARAAAFLAVLMGVLVLHGSLCASAAESTGCCAVLAAPADAGSTPVDVEPRTDTWRVDTPSGAGLTAWTDATPTSEDLSGLFGTCVAALLAVLLALAALTRPLPWSAALAALRRITRPRPVALSAPSPLRLCVSRT